MASDREVVQLGAAIGRTFGYDLHPRRVRPLTRRRCGPSWASWSRPGCCSRRGRPPRSTYTFKHALIQDAAYQSLVKKTAAAVPPADRARRWSSVPRGGRDAAGAAGPPLHRGRADGPGAWISGTGRPTGRSAGAPDVEAVEQLHRGLDLLRALPDTAARRAREIKMHVALGVPLQATRGVQRPEVEATSRRPRNSLARAGRPARTSPWCTGCSDITCSWPSFHKAQDLAKSSLSQAAGGRKERRVPGGGRAGPWVGGAGLPGQYPAAIDRLRRVIAIARTAGIASRPRTPTTSWTHGWWRTRTWPGPCG